MTLGIVVSALGNQGRRSAHLANTRPTTSSITAALTRIEPTRVWERSTSFAADPITEKVVPNEVADSADPMMNVSTAPG